MQVPVYNINGEVVKQIDIDDSVFAVPLNEAVVHQAVVMQLAHVLTSPILEYGWVQVTFPL